MTIVKQQIDQAIQSKWEFILIFLLLHSWTVFGQVYSGPIPQPTSGYGSDGTHTVEVISFPNPNFISEEIKLFYPSDIPTQVPTLFYSHAYGGYFPISVAGLLHFVAKKGYAIVFVPYPVTGSTQDRYDNLLAGFLKAARDYPAIIDTTKVGFIGHSLGGGASFGISYKCFTQYNWGENGRFIHASAPWYSFDITQTELQSFPSNTKLLVEVYDNDPVNDHRMAIDIFYNINISNSEKDFITVRSDTIDSYLYEANHDLPTNTSEFDALDYYAYFRLIDALCDYTFNGSLVGKEVALGNGSAAQITMPIGLKNLSQTDSPQALYPESNYIFPCSAWPNPRQMYCNTILSSIEIPIADQQTFIFPNPSSDFLSIKSDKEISRIEVFNIQGQLVKSVNTQNKEVSISISELPSGFYFVIANLSNGYLWTDKLIKE
jgi:Secretion system C-terminal sorting domain